MQGGGKWRFNHDSKKPDAVLKKIVVIGPESTGKSTLSQDVAAALNTLWVPEFARDYLENIGQNYVEDDLLNIAQGQLALEDDFAQKAATHLICDTDLYVIKVWSEARYGQCHRYILEEIARRPYHLYLLTYIDIVWEDDPLREHAHPNERSYFYHQYRDIVQQSGVPWVDVRGDRDHRLQTALQAIGTIL